MNSSEDKIVITGIGIVSPIGTSHAGFWKNLQKGISGINKVSLFDTESISSKTAGEIFNFNYQELLGVKGLRNLDRTTLLALSASKLALLDGNFHLTNENADTIGVALGLTAGHIWSKSEFDKERIKNGQNSVNPAHFPNTVMNAPAGQISIYFGIKGFNTTITTGYPSAVDAMEYARQFLALNRVDAVLVGGVEALSEHLYKSFYKTKLISGSKSSEELCAPYDKRRNGIVLGEGSVMFLMEKLKNAKKRDAKIYCEFKGAAVSNDYRAYNSYVPKSRSPIKAINKALALSKVGLEEIDYIAGGANSSIEGDAIESIIIRKLFLKLKKVPPISSMKSMIGETFSASSAFQVVSAICALTTSILHPTINFKIKDARCNVDCIPNESRKLSIRAALVPVINPMNQTTACVLANV